MRFDEIQFQTGAESFSFLSWKIRKNIPKKIFSKLLKLKPGKGGEIHITDAIQSLINEKNKFIAHTFSGKYLDCGSMNGYIKSTLEIAKSWNYAW